VLDGEVEIDGAYFGGHIRPANLASERVDRRKAEHQTGTRRVVVALRQRKGRTLTFVTKGEAEGVELAQRYVDRLATLFADEASHWDHLHQAWPTFRINHSEAYSLDGANTNAVESFFSRLRRMINGQHHGVSPVRQPRRLARGSPPPVEWRQRPCHGGKCDGRASQPGLEGLLAACDVTH
jgi:hypothetical protein